MGTGLFGLLLQERMQEKKKSTVIGLDKQKILA